MLDIFNNSAFTVTSLTDAMREIKYAPSFVSSLGLFQSTSVRTLSVAIEKDKEQNQFLVASSPRGGPGQTFGKNKRQMRNLTIPHFQVDDAIMAEEVQGVRAFGQDMAVQSLAAVIADRAAEASQAFALNEEFHRLKLLTEGKIYDADGTTVLYDFYSEFGESAAAEVDWDLDNASPTDGILRQKAATLTRAMGEALGGLPFSGIMALCGDTFFDQLIQHKEVRETYKGYEAAAALRQSFLPNNNGSVNSGVWAQVDMFGIRWVNYRGGGGVTIGATKAHFVPMGVPGLFRSVYAPADYMGTVNTPGQRLYAKTWIMPNEKGVNLEFQTNVLHYVTRPRVLMKAKNT